MAHEMDFTRGWPFALVRPGERISLTELKLREQAMTQAPLMASLPKRHLRRLAETTAVQRYEPKSAVVTEGQPGSAFFVILEGEARVRIGSRTVAKLDPGDFFGEISLLDGGRRTASVVADSSLLCLRLAGSEFLKTLENDQALTMKLLKTVAGRLREAEAPPAG
jgi:CRP/FNR family transcriptional regulator, cyclic AMP receptor protein